jgi:hypothetical protein
VADPHEDAAAARARGKMWPGRDMSSAVDPGSTATCTVRALSYADMPVVMPSFASMETVKAVL